MYQVDNAIIMAAGMSSRFAPLSYVTPKALLNVRGEILIERQIRQLLEAGITEIVVIVGYKKEQFAYLREKYGVILIENEDYEKRNNHSSIYKARKYLGNSYICSADNYFVDNPFEKEVTDAYYAMVFEEGETKEWCVSVDENDRITDVTIGGNHSWYMLGHAFWNKEFSEAFLEILNQIYDKEETRDKLWEQVYMEHIDELRLQIRRYSKETIWEFDSLEELCEFDETYKEMLGEKHYADK